MPVLRSDQMKDAGMRRALREALGGDGRLSDQDVVELLGATLDGAGITPYERRDLQRILQSSKSLSAKSRGWLRAFLYLCDRQEARRLTFDRLRQSYARHGAEPPKGWYQTDYGRAGGGGSGSCGIRLSLALRAIGWTFKTFAGKSAWPSATARDRLPVNAAELKTYLDRVLGKGLPIRTGSPVSKYRQGIVFLDVVGASGHVTLWDGNRRDRKGRPIFEDAPWLPDGGDLMSAGGGNAAFWDLRPHWIKAG